jgi:hypothetical protein
MATWQADFAVELPGGRMPEGYRNLLRDLLPEGRSWSDDEETWGTETSDRIDVFHADGNQDEVLARFDMRQWQPELYARFIRLVQTLNASIRVASDRHDALEVAPTLESFEQALRASDAFRFVADPDAFVRGLAEEHEQE